MKIYGFAGRKRSGKTTLANVMVEKYGAKRFSIADNLKKLCCKLLNMSLEELLEKKDNGYAFDKVFTKDEMVLISQETGIAPNYVFHIMEGQHYTNIRELLQVLGTDLIRAFNPDWHINRLVDEIKNLQDTDTIVCIDDIRFPNEVKALSELGAEIFFIVRCNMCNVSNHSSETSLKWQDFPYDHVLLNTIALDGFLTFFEHYLKYNITNMMFLSNNTELLTEEIVNPSEKSIKTCKKLIDEIKEGRGSINDFSVILLTKDIEFYKQLLFSVFGEGAKEKDISPNRKYFSQPFKGEYYFTIYNCLYLENLKILL